MDRRKLIINYLLSLDTSKRVDLNSERNKHVREGVHGIMTQICQKIKEIDPRFSGNLVPMGSAHNQTKIDDLNELDYVQELNTSDLLNGKGTFCRYLGKGHRDNIVLDFGADADYELCKPFIKISDDLPSSSGNTNQNDITLDIAHIHTLFCDILSKVLQELQLPPGWCHGGFNRPNFSGMRYNGIACLLQFDYLETCEKEPLRLSVDFVPMVRIPIVSDKGRTSSLDRFLEKITNVKHSWVSLQNGELFYSNAEELWLAEFSSDSMPKTLMRIGKGVGTLLKMNSKCPISREQLRVIKTRTRENSGICSLQISSNTFKCLLDTDDYVTYSDLGEIVGDNCLMKSYVIKRIVMYMMMASESHGHKWTEDDPPDLVICVYLILTGVIDKYRSPEYVWDFEFLEENFSVHLKDKSGINEEAKCPIRLQTEQLPTHFRRKITQKDLQTQTDVFHEISYHLNLDYVPLLLSRISGVFQLLRSVCEGKNTAEIFTHKNEPGLQLAYIRKEDYMD